MQGWGENNSPPPRFGLGQADPGPALSSGPGLAQKIMCFLFFGPRSGQKFWAESGPVGWAGPAMSSGPDLAQKSLFGPKSAHKFWG